MSVICTIFNKCLIENDTENNSNSYLILCDLKEIAKKRNLDKCENYPIYGMFFYKQIKVFVKQSKSKRSKLLFWQSVPSVLRHVYCLVSLEIHILVTHHKYGEKHFFFKTN